MLSARTAVLLAAALVSVGIARPATGADRYVSVDGTDAGHDCLTNGDPCATIGHAITQAASGDVIKVSRGNYAESLGINSSTTLTVSGAWTEDFSSRDPAAHPSMIQLESASYLLQVGAGAGQVLDVTVDGFTFVGGYYSTVTASASDDGSLTFRLQNSTLTRAHLGSLRVYASQTSTVDVSISNCAITRNRTADWTVVFESSDSSLLDVTLDDVTIARNFPPSFNMGDPTTTLWVQAEETSSLNLVGTRLAVLKNRGDAVAIHGDSTCNVSLIDSRVDGARGIGGNGIIAFGPGLSLSLTNTVVARNRARYFGAAGLGFSGPSLTLVNSTIRRNRAGDGVGGLDVFSGTADITNTIIWGNRSVSGDADDLTIGSATVNIDHSDLGDVDGTFNDLGGNISSDPLFVNGRDDHLTPSSPAVDTGTCSGAPATDFEGDPRPSGTGCDMGADELAP